MARETVDMSFGEATGPVDWDGLVSMPRPPRLQYEGALYDAYTRRCTLSQLARATCEVFAIPEQDLRSRSRTRDTSRARQALCRVARKLAIASASQLAEYLQRDPSVISHLLSGSEQSEESAEVKALVERMTCPGVACGQ